MTLNHSFSSQLCPLRLKPAVTTGSSSGNISTAASVREQWSPGAIIWDWRTLLVHTHVSAPPQIPSTNHLTYTHKPLDQAYFPHWKILCAQTECIPLAFHEDEPPFFFLRSNRIATIKVKTESLLPLRCSGLHAKQHELTQHIVSKGFCNTNHNPGCASSAVSTAEYLLFLFITVLRKREYF